MREHRRAGMPDHARRSRWPENSCSRPPPGTRGSGTGDLSGSSCTFPRPLRLPMISPGSCNPGGGTTCLGARRFWVWRAGSSMRHRAWSLSNRLLAAKFPDRPLASRHSHRRHSSLALRLYDPMQKAPDRPSTDQGTRPSHPRQLQLRRDRRLRGRLPFGHQSFPSLPPSSSSPAQQARHGRFRREPPPAVDRGRPSGWSSLPGSP